jgi:hypothetical protein
MGIGSHGVVYTSMATELSIDTWWYLTTKVYLEIEYRAEDIDKMLQTNHTAAFMTTSRCQKNAQI